MKIERKICVAAALVLLFFSAGCRTGNPPPQNTNANQKTQTSPQGNANPVKPVSDLVDCNYFWPQRGRHVCIKNMPRRECEDLFSTNTLLFERENVCFCDASGREKSPVQGTDYIMYDCGR